MPRAAALMGCCSVARWLLLGSVTAVEPRLVPSTSLRAGPERRLQVACRRVICRQPAHHTVDPQHNPLTARLVILRDRRARAAGRLLVDGPHVHRRAAANHRFDPVPVGVIGVAGRDAAAADAGRAVLSVPSTALRVNSGQGVGHTAKRAPTRRAEPPYADGPARLHYNRIGADTVLLNCALILPEGCLISRRHTGPSYWGD